MPWCEEGIFFLEFNFVECLVMTHGRITVVEIVLDMGSTTVKNEQTNKKKILLSQIKKGRGGEDGGQYANSSLSRSAKPRHHDNRIEMD